MYIYIGYIFSYIYINHLQKAKRAAATADLSLSQPQVKSCLGRQILAGKEEPKTPNRKENWEGWIPWRTRSLISLPFCVKSNQL